MNGDCVGVGPEGVGAKLFIDDEFNDILSFLSFFLSVADSANREKSNFDVHDDDVFEF